ERERRCDEHDPERECQAFARAAPGGHANRVVVRGRRIMAGLVADFVLRRLTEGGVHRIFGYPGDGINGFLGALDRADKDELPKLMPDDEDAKRLSCQTFHFAEFLCARGYEPPRLHGRAVLHGHYHEKATDGFDPTKQLLERMGLQLELPDSGC